MNLNSSPQQQRIKSTELSEGEMTEKKRLLFEARKALEWNIANRDVSVRETYAAAVEKAKQEMADNGITEEEYSSYLKDRTETLH